ncbi:MAG: hypothetical protein ACE5DP_02760 [Fidelibacterota bacterium]
MLVVRFIPPKSQTYQKLSEISRTFDGLRSWKPLQWFTVWILFSAGLSAQEASVTPFIYWDFSSWLTGLASLLIITLLYGGFIGKRGRIVFGREAIKRQNLLKHFVLAEGLFLLGWGFHLSTWGQALLASLPYLCGYFATLLVYALPIVTIPAPGEEPEQSWPSKHVSYGLVALLLVLIATVLGYIYQDPVISTAAAVYAPFLLVLIVFPAHVRHVQRARFYPIFLLAFFISMRLPWLFIPTILLFYCLRYYFYFRHQVVYPTFGVDYD